ncbi:MAG TPA: hypothetical protein VNA27_12715 [Rubrobacteraceae bacterium]|nr:hypothetical protein [Rubrobacteraceae bacterium]
MLAGIALLAGCSPEETESYSQAGEKPAVFEETVGRAAEQADEPTQTKKAVAETTVKEPTVESRCYREKEDEIRIGDFEPPEEGVPEYEIIEETPVERDGAEAVRLLVDTLARSEEDYTLITRDIKSRYAELDAASIEFTDTTRILSYNGGAAIFNTPCGSDYIGYVYRPPNNEGYRVTVAKD